ncbi:MAG: sigma 54-interacting transcriptional regulator [Pseudobdellovibrionaceae bacterium]|nr:MAG: sigma 54-interacting transcriptional regulator [Pseudobdellovibrionaceae bacterium]
MIENAELLQLLNQISADVFDREKSDELVERILKVALKLTESDRGTVFLVKPARLGSHEKVLNSLFATGLNGEKIHMNADRGIAGKVFRTGEPVIINDVSTSSDFFPAIDKQTGYQTENILAAPLKSPKHETLGVIEILNKKSGDYNEKDLQIVQVLSIFAGIALEHKFDVENLVESKEKLKQVNYSWLKKAEFLLHQSLNPNLQAIYEKIEDYAMSDSAVLIQGESGTGKEGMTQLIHIKSQRKNQPFVAVNCAAIPESLFEAELFGVAKGAATGTAERRGKVELAHGGTLFLDEVGELPLKEQAKLLRVLQDHSVTRVGSEEEPTHVDFRLVCATNRDLRDMVNEGQFREDLFYRLNVIHLKIPPLRDRQEDIPSLAVSILNQLSRKSAYFRDKKLSDKAIEYLKTYDWPGNIRELQNKIENAGIVSRDRSLIEPKDFQLTPTQRAPKVDEDSPTAIVLNLHEAKAQAEQRVIEQALRIADGNKTKAAEILGISREGLRKALKKAG